MLYWQYPIHLFSRLVCRLRRRLLQLQSLIMEDLKRERERSRGDYFWQVASTNRNQNWKISFKSEVSQSSQYRRAAMLCIGEVEDAKSLDDLITSASVAGRPIPDFENLQFEDCMWTQEDPNTKLQETSYHSRRKGTIGEEIPNRQTDCVDDLRRLHKSVATMKPSWTSENYQQSNCRTTTSRPSTRSGTKYCQ